MDRGVLRVRLYRILAGPGYVTDGVLTFRIPADGAHGTRIIRAETDDGGTATRARMPRMARREAVRLSQGQVEGRPRLVVLPRDADERNDVVAR